MKNTVKLKAINGFVKELHLKPVSVNSEELTAIIEVEFESSGDIRDISKESITTEILLRIKKALLELVFTKPEEKEFTESDMMDFYMWYFENKELALKPMKQALDIWKESLHR